MSTRVKLSFELVCAVCNAPLESEGNGRFTRNSAYEESGVMRIIPCQRCIEKATGPIRAIRGALGLEIDE